MTSYCYICVLILLHMCPHTATYVSSYCYICALILLHMCLILLHMYARTATCVSSYCYICVLICYICVLMLLYMCPHTAIYVSSYCYMCPHAATCILILLYVCPHTAVYVSSCCYKCVLNCYICVLILLYMRPHAATYVSSYCHICVLCSASARRPALLLMRKDKEQNTKLKSKLNLTKTVLRARQLRARRAANLLGNWRRHTDTAVWAHTHTDTASVKQHDASLKLRARRAPAGAQVRSSGCFFGLSFFKFFLIFFPLWWGALPDALFRSSGMLLCMWPHAAVCVCWYWYPLESPDPRHRFCL